MMVRFILFAMHGNNGYENKRCFVIKLDFERRPLHEEAVSAFCRKKIWMGKRSLSGTLIRYGFRQ